MNSDEQAHDCDVPNTQVTSEVVDVPVIDRKNMFLPGEVLV